MIKKRAEKKLWKIVWVHSFLTVLETSRFKKSTSRYKYYTEMLIGILEEKVLDFHSNNFDFRGDSRRINRL